MDDMGMDMGSEAPEMGDEASEPAGFEPKDDFEREAADFLDDSLPVESRIGALREAIKLCADEDYGGGEDEGGEGGGKKPAGGLALIFGPKKKG